MRFDSVLLKLKFPTSELANLILKPFQLGKKDWAHFRRSLNHSAPPFITHPCGLTLRYAAYKVVNSHGFCIKKESHNFCSWRGMLHCQLFDTLSGNWRGEISYCLSVIFSQRFSTAAVKWRSTMAAQTRKSQCICCCHSPWQSLSSSCGRREMKQGIFLILSKIWAL